MLAHMNATDCRWAIGSPNACAFLDVGDDVVEHRVRRCRPPAPPSRVGTARWPPSSRSSVASSSPSRADSGTVTLSSSTRPSAAARMPMLGSALTVRPFDDDSTMNMRRLAVELRCDDEQFGVRGGGHQRLDAVEAVAARRAHGGGLQRGRIEQRMRFGDRHAGLRHVLARELREVGGLLVGAAPVGERRRDAAGRQDRQRQSHVAVGQRLGDQRVGDRAPGARRCRRSPRGR